jgi:type I restriction enzyme, S subunit
MMKGWIRESLGDICRKGGGRIQTGPFGSQLHEADYQSEGVPVVMPTDLKSGKIQTTRIARVSESHVERLKRHKFVKGDIVYGRRGDIGRQSLIRAENEGWLCGTGCLKISLGNGPVFHEFLHRYLSTNSVIGWIEDQAVGATMPNLNTGILYRVPVLYPECRQTQQKIAAILSAYDDLIANNQRRITLLERMAEDIYREWFVRLRFPGHEQVKIEKGVPQGWRFAELSEMASINSSSLKKGSRQDRIQYIDISAVTTNHIAELTEIALAEAPGRARRLVKHGDVIWSSVRPANRAYCLIYEPPENLIASTGFAVISPKPGIPFTFINFAVTSDSYVEQMAMVAKGSAYPATSFDDFGKAKVLRPLAELLDRFHALCEPMFRRRHQLREINTALAKQRDALLPRLISGKLVVDGLDIRLPPGMVAAA